MPDLESMRNFWQDADPPLAERKARLLEFWDMSRPPARWVRGVAPPDADWNHLHSFEARLEKFLEGAPQCLKDCPDYIPVFPTQIGPAQQASAFGCEVIQVQDNDTFWGRQLFHDYDPDHILSMTPPAPDAGFQGESIEHARQAEEFFGGAISVRIGDMQGPVDVAGQVWGEENLFRAMFEHPEAAHHLIGLAADLLIGFHKAQEAVVSEFIGMHCPSNIWMPPGFGTALSEDYAPLLSPRLYEEFSLPYVNRISDACGGVWIHCCGNFTHNFGNFLKIKNLRGINPAPPIIDWEQLVALFGEVCCLAPGMSLGGAQRWGDDEGFKKYLAETTPKGAHLFVNG
jgi:hypothetical protein